MTKPLPAMIARARAALCHPLAGVAVALIGLATFARPAVLCLYWSTVGPADRAGIEAYRALCADAPQLMAHGIALGGCLVGLGVCAALALRRRP
jgi:hypothetical protein